MALYQRAFVDDPDTDDIEKELEQEVELVVPENAPPEEKTFAKRYADLRRYSQSQLAKIKKEKEDLEKQLSEAGKSHLQLPNADDDKAVDTWIQNYPDLARILTRLADRQAEKRTQEVKANVDALQEERKRLEKENANTKLAAAHPDFFDTIRVDEKFHDWLAGKSKAIQNIMYGEDADWKDASDVITMYKLENSIKTKKETPNNNKDIVREVPVRGKASPTALTEGQFTESQVERMSSAEYDFYEEKIEEARRTGKFIYDKTGGAR